MKSMKRMLGLLLLLLVALAAPQAALAVVKESNGRELSGEITAEIGLQDGDRIVGNAWTSGSVMLESGTVTVSADATLEIYGSLTINEGATLINKGVIYAADPRVPASLPKSGNIQGNGIMLAASITNKGTIENRAEIRNYYVIENRYGAQILNAGMIQNGFPIGVDRVAQGDDIIDLPIQESYFGQAQILNDGTIENQGGQIINNGVILNFRTFNGELAEGSNQVQPFKRPTVKFLESVTIKAGSTAPLMSISENLNPIDVKVEFFISDERILDRGKIAKNNDVDAHFYNPDAITLEPGKSADVTLMARAGLAAGPYKKSIEVDFIPIFPSGYPGPRWGEDENITITVTSGSTETPGGTTDPDDGGSSDGSQNTPPKPTPTTPETPETPEKLPPASGSGTPDDNTGQVNITITIKDSEGEPAQATGIPDTEKNKDALEQLKDMGLTATVTEEGTIEITGTAMNTGTVVLDVEVKRPDGTTETVQVTVEIKSVERTTDTGVSTDPQSWTGELTESTDANGVTSYTFIIYVPLDINATDANKAADPEATIVGGTITNVEIVGVANAAARGAQSIGALSQPAGVSMKISGRVSDPETARITKVSYRVGANRYVQSVNVKLSDTAAAASSGSTDSGSGGCASGLPFLALLAAAYAWHRGRKAAK